MNTVTAPAAHDNEDTATIERKTPRATSREQEVLRLLTTGLNSQGIAESMNVSKHTVTFHLHSIYKKFNIKNRVDAYKLAQSLGLTDSN